MKLIGSLIVRNELGRYLAQCVGSLLEFCDELRILDDGSTDGWQDVLRDERIVCLRDPPVGRDGEPDFFQHARARNRLLEFTLAGEPTHVLAIDADEFVADGAALRAACNDGRFDVLRLCLQEIWNAHPDRLDVRQDGGWREHDVPMLWRPGRLRRPLRIVDRGHATGRVPELVYRARAGHACTCLLHFGWVNRAERRQRYERYAVGDGGRFHAKVHIESIMWPDAQITLQPEEWPAGLASYKDALLERSNAIVG